MTEARIVPPGFQDVDQAVTNSAVFVWSHYLTWQLEANTDYTYESLIVLSADPEAGFKYRLIAPDDVSIWLDVRPDADVVGETERGGQEIEPKSSPHRARGVIKAGTLGAGELRFEFTQRTPHSSATILQRGSWIRLTQVDPQAGQAVTVADQRRPE